MKIIFLDFDGVLHPIKSGTIYFEKCELLSKLLDEIDPEKEIKLVISSDWRYSHSLEQLKDLIGTLGERVIGKNPTDLYIENNSEILIEVEHDDNEGENKKIREMECEKFIRENKIDVDWYFAIDDCDNIFSKSFPLFKIENGINDIEIKNIEGYIKHLNLNKKDFFLKNMIK